MRLKISKNDIERHKVITIILFLFIMLSALLIAGASSMIMELFGSMDSLFKKSNAPHFVQMHSGALDQFEIDVFAANNSFVKDQQTIEMINIDGSNIFLGNYVRAEENSVMESGFVKQNNIL